MRTIQVIIDEPLLIEVDRTIEELGITRSAFIRDALRLALWRHRLVQMEHEQAEGYAKHPPQPGEFDSWEDEQVWSQL